MFSSCDKAREFVQRNTTKVPATVGTPPGGQADPELAGKVQKQDSGVVFRKDLPFPTSVSVKTEERVTWTNGRKIGKSELGTETASFNGTYETVINWHLEKAVATMKVEKAAPLIDPNAPSDVPPFKAPPELDSLSALIGKTYSLQKTTAGWSRVLDPKKENDFRELVWAKAVTPGAGGLFAEAGLLPRPRWFPSSRSFKAGDKIELSGESLLLLFAGKPVGTVSLTFEDSDSVAGHPVGRFSISGNVQITDLMSPDGDPAGLNLAISSGQIWFSLLHPMVVREDYEAVETLTRGQDGAPNSRIQGTVKVVRSRTWSALQ